MAPLDQPSMRWLGVLAMAAFLSACAASDGTGYFSNRFRNPQTGAVVAACGPYIGLAQAVSDAEKGCTDAYERQGWVKLPLPMAS